MANISEEIEQFILSVLGDSDEVTLSRSQLADYFSVAPSQINYVLRTRFNVCRGYITGSKRGGGGNISIVRIAVDDELIPSILRDLEDSKGLSQNNACDIADRLLRDSALTERECGIIKAALSDKALAASDNSAQLRRNIYGEILTELMRR